MSITKAVLFDLNGTLVNREVGARNWLHHHFRMWGAGPEMFAAFYADFQRLDSRGQSSKLETFAALAEKWIWPRTPEEIWSDYRQNVWRFCELFPDALPTLEHLRGVGLKLGIITNGTVECQESKINQLGLAPLVDVTLISEREGIKKPAPELFARSCKRLDLSANQCLIVGDSLKADVEGALAAGLQAVLLNRDSERPVEWITTMRSLLELALWLTEYSPKSRG